jgi:hypothetical protein
MTLSLQVCPWCFRCKLESEWRPKEIGFANHQTITKLCKEPIMMQLPLWHWRKEMATPGNSKTPANTCKFIHLFHIYWLTAHLCETLWNLFFFFFSHGVWIYGLMLSRQVLYPLSHATSPDTGNITKMTSTRLVSPRISESTKREDMWT